MSEDDAVSREEDAVSREEARLLRSMAHAAKPTSRPRSWSVKREAQDYKDLKEQIQKEEQQQRAPSPNFHTPNNETQYNFKLPSPRFVVEPPVNHSTTSHEYAVPRSTSPPVNTIVESPRKDEVPTSHLSEEDKQREQERQVKMEQERFNRYLGRTSVTKKEPMPQSPRKEVSVPQFPTSVAAPKIVADKSPRVLLEITGAGATKAEAGKSATFVIKSKSVNIAAEKSSVDVSVKIIAKNAEGQVVEVANNVHIEHDGYHVTYTPTYIGPHNVDIFVLGQLGHTMNVDVHEGGPRALNTDATYYTLKSATVGNKAQLVVTPMSYIRRLVPLGYSTLAAKVDHVESNTGIKNVSVLGNKEGHYVVSFYPAQAGNHIISVTLNGEHISGSPFVFYVLG